MVHWGKNLSFFIIFLVLSSNVQGSYFYGWFGEKLEEPIQQTSLKRTLFTYVPLLTKNVYEALKEAEQEFGSSSAPIQIRIPGFKNIIIFSDPQHITEIVKHESNGNLVKGYTINYIKKYLLGEGFAALEMDNQIYKNLHKLFSPFFSSRHIANHFSLNRKWSEDFIDSLKDRDDQVINLENQIRIFAMGAISRSFLEYEISYDLSKKMNDCINRIVEYTFYKQINWPFVLPDFFPIELNYIYQEAIGEMKVLAKKILYNGVEKERNEKTFLQALRDSEYDEKIKVDQIINIFFGGHETTAHWLTMCFYRLLSRPDVFKRVQEEINNLPEEWQSNDMKNNRTPYLDAFTKEVLRLDSSISVYGRDAVRNIKIGGYHVAKGSLVLLSQYHTHRNKKQWVKPYDFLPERFLAENKSEDSKYGKRHIRSYIPFGVGPRSCIGRFISEAEVKIFLTTFLRQSDFTLELVDKNDPEIEIVCTTRLKNGLPVKIIRH